MSLLSNYPRVAEGGNPGLSGRAPSSKGNLLYVRLALVGQVSVYRYYGLAGIQVLWPFS